MRFAGVLCLLLIISMVIVPSVALIKTELPVNSTFSQKTDAETSSDSDINTISVLISESGKVEKMNITDYVIGAVSAETNPDFEEEAIKAQAVACYTYTLYMIENNSFDGADISDDWTKHQGYLSKEKLKEKWGSKFDTYYSKIEKAVLSVKNKVLKYDSEIIQPAFFALCAGKTENSADIWGGNVPYLKSVVSPGDNLSPDLTSSQEFDENDFKKCASKLKNCDFDSDAEKWISDIEKTAAGAVKTIKICGNQYSGSEIQSAFSLRSNNFTVKYENNKFIFTVIGNGHGVGMSQYGADYMARQGSTYDEILKHYYTGIEICDI